MGKAFALLAAAAAGAVAGPASAASTDGKNRKVVVQNVSSQAIYNLYASPVTAKTWEEDLLGQGTLAGRAAADQANIDNGTNECMYDLKVVMAERQGVRAPPGQCLRRQQMGDRRLRRIDPVKPAVAAAAKSCACRPRRDRACLARRAAA